MQTVFTPSLKGRKLTPFDRFEKSTRWFQEDAEIPDSIKVGLVATVWLSSVETFRESEEDRLISDAANGTENYSQGHKIVLTTLISQGEVILDAIKSFGLPPKFKEFSVEDFESAIESLYISLRSEYGPKNHPKIDAQIDSIFNAA